jgi:hypothetical protein
MPHLFEGCAHSVCHNAKAFAGLCHQLHLSKPVLLLTAAVFGITILSQLRWVAHVPHPGRRTFILSLRHSRTALGAPPELPAPPEPVANGTLADVPRSQHISRMDTRSFSIPRIIWQTAKSHFDAPKAGTECYDSWTLNNPAFDHYLLDDDEVSSFVAKAYGAEVARAFDELPLGVMKADLFRCDGAWAWCGVLHFCVKRPCIYRSYKLRTQAKSHVCSLYHCQLRRPLCLQVHDFVHSGRSVRRHGHQVQHAYPPLASFRVSGHHRPGEQFVRP